ncbi:MAG: ester cyclase [Anaerolineae bacterium]|nr:ester cyclase [Anaerolineae bacterium]MBN8617558.1 ester cyclase [Anaerolineae bacterium]
MNSRQKRLGMILSLLLIALLTFTFAFAQEETPVTPEQEEAQRESLIRVAEEVILPGSYENLSDFIADEYVVHTPLGDLDRDGLAGFFTSVQAALTDFNMVRENILVDGRFAATRLTISGIFENEYASPMGPIPPTGGPVVVEVINIFQFNDDGKIIEEWVQFDVLGFLTQLGAMPAPGS